MKFDDCLNTLDNWKFISLTELASEKYRNRMKVLVQRATVELCLGVVEEQYSGFAEQQSRDGERSVGTHGVLFAGTTSGGLGRTAEPSTHVFRQANARESRGLEASQRHITAEKGFV